MIPALHSRCQGFHMETIDKTEFTARACEILIQEGITPDIEILDTYVKASYPDMRKCINMLQQNCRDGKLMPPASGTRNKDMGSIFEAGYMNCLEKPIVYFCDGLPPGAQFNLMLAASGIKVCRSLEDLDVYLAQCKVTERLVIDRYVGEIE